MVYRIDRSYAPKGATAAPGGAVIYWHVDDVAATLEKLTALGATEYEPLIPREIEAIAAILADAELTAAELTEALVDHVGSWTRDPVMPAFQGMWPRWRLVLATAGIRGALCFGPNHGRNITYTSPRRWLPGFRPADERTALAHLLKHYLYAYGPATPQQFAQWLAAPRRWAIEPFDTLSGELQQVEVDGALAWVIVGDTIPPPEPPQGVQLLPYFDAYIVGCHPRAKVFPGQAAERALAGGQAGNFPVLLIAGTVAGVWHQRRSGQKLDVTVEPLTELAAAQRHELDEQVENYRQKRGAAPFLAELTVPEVRRLLEIALPLPPRSIELRLAWSAWRRAKRYLTWRYHHRRARSLSFGSSVICYNST